MSNEEGEHFKVDQSATRLRGPIDKLTVSHTWAYQEIKERLDIVKSVFEDYLESNSMKYLGNKWGWDLVKVYLKELGNEPERVKEILEELRRKHNSCIGTLSEIVRISERATFYDEGEERYVRESRGNVVRNAKKLESMMICEFTAAYKLLFESPDIFRYFEELRILTTTGYKEKLRLSRKKSITNISSNGRGGRRRIEIEPEPSTDEIIEIETSTEEMVKIEPIIVVQEEKNEEVKPMVA